MLIVCALVLGTAALLILLLKNLQQRIVSQLPPPVPPANNCTKQEFKRWRTLYKYWWTEHERIHSGTGRRVLI